MAKKQYKQDEKSLTTKQSDEEILAVWKSNFTTARGKVPSIYLDNNKLDKDGEKNPDFGTIFAVKMVEDKEVKDVIKTGEQFLPVLRRVQVACRTYVDTAERNEDGKPRKKAKYWCRETDIGEDIELRDMDGEVVYTGPYKSAKDQYELKYREVIYAYWNEQVYRWKISGQKTLGSWFSTMNKVDTLGTPHYVEIKEVEADSNSGIFWNNIYFGVGEKANLKEWATLFAQLKDALSSYYAEVKKEEKESEVKDLGGFESDKKDPDFPL